eukprot:CAMPEP_0194129600 /NCGR_PEP_ID=MMETSP0152-20130528/816_1 /TAXON_ID=1049557 /ORGANISM="Thalassiothrix antarctica, Strain L6-D1" /LENGTH=75 /DNA_ID=CAMNT_0038823877 /DNA_START=74 /DNA_END=298 /DNA_ORIENTATION=+
MKIAILALFILASSAAATKDASFDLEVYNELDKELDELQTLMKEYENSAEESNWDYGEWLKSLGGRDKSDPKGHW